ncbi:MAG: substrate-binding domain-containing protein [Treponema sp.]|nr:substrate-binding domain-containing protein [Treponema sp.]
MKLGVLLPAPVSPWTRALYREAVQAVTLSSMESRGGFEFRMRSAASSGEQIEQIHELAAWGAGWLVIFPLDSAAVTPVLKELHSRGKRIVAADQGLTDRGFGWAGIAWDHEAIGTETARALGLEMKHSLLANYLCLGGGGPVGAELMDAFFREMEQSPFLVNILGGRTYIPTGYDPADAYREAAALFRRFPRIDAVYCPDDDALVEVLKAAEEADRSDIRLFFGTGGSMAVCALILDPESKVEATALRGPSIAGEAVRFAVSAAREKEGAVFHNAPGPKTIRIPTALIDRSNAEHYAGAAAY